MSEELRTSEEVQRYMARALETDRRFRVFECRTGWVCRPVLDSAEVAEGRGLGLGNYVVHRTTGVVTAHRSLPPELIGAECDEAIASGRPVPGYRVYPRP